MRTPKPNVVHTKKKVHEKKKVEDPDEVLTEQLRIAEEALIAALEALSGPPGTHRRVGYQSRLENAQTAVTSLYREELVRIRGHMSPKTLKVTPPRE